MLVGKVCCLGWENGRNGKQNGTNGWRDIKFSFKHNKLSNELVWLKNVYDERISGKYKSRYIDSLGELSNLSRMVLKFVYTSITLNNLCLHSAFSHVQILAGVIIIINLVVSVS